MEVVWFGDWEGSGWIKTGPNFEDLVTKKPAISHLAMELSSPNHPIQAIMVFYLYAKFEINWSNNFQVRVWKPHPDRRTSDTSI